MNRFGFKLVCLLVSAATLLPGVAAETSPADSRRNALGVGVLYQSPGDPLDDGAGLGVQYTRSLKRLLLRAELATLSLDEQAPGQGDFDFLLFSVGALWPVSPETWRVRLAVGGGIDYVDGDRGSDTIVEPPPIDIRSTFDVDAGVGFHGDFEAALPIGSDWELYGRVRYLAASLDAEQRFLISGVPGGNPVGVDLELDGPQLTLGAAFRF